MSSDELAELASLFGELCSEHRAVERAWERPDLNPEVRAFWRALGLSKATAWMAPRENAAKDEELLIEVFDEWLESPYFRDRWAIEPAEGPLPRRMLPPNRPRLLGGTERSPRIILGDEGVPGGNLYRFDGARLEPLDVGYKWWCLHNLLREGTRSQCGAYLNGPELPSTPAVTGLDSPLLRAGEGVYVLQKSPLSNRDGLAMPYRDLGSYARFVLSCPEEVRRHFFDPDALRVTFKVKKSNKQLHPEQPTAWSGLSRFFLTELSAKPTHSERAAGQLDGRWVWVQLSHLRDGGLSLLTDPADEEAVVASLVARGAIVTSKELLRRVLSAPNW